MTLKIYSIVYIVQIQSQPCVNYDLHIKDNILPKDGLRIPIYWVPSKGSKKVTHGIWYMIHVLQSGHEEFGSTRTTSESPEKDFVYD